MPCTYAIGRVIDKEKPHAREVIFSIGFAEYKVTLQAIMRDFSEGLRVIGLKPHEKIALFADNSCRWLVADQGKSIDTIHKF